MFGSRGGACGAGVGVGDVYIGVSVAGVVVVVGVPRATVEGV